MPIVEVPVLTPRLSSYWLALVTDVDVTTGRNLIDSMGTEVLVTDHSIRDLVPGEPIAYAEAVRRALEDAELGEADADRSRSAEERAGAAKSIDDRPDDVGDDRGQDAAGGAALEADERRRAARPAKASITLPVASVATV